MKPLRAIAVYKPVPKCIGILREVANTARTRDISLEIYTVDDLADPARGGYTRDKCVNVVFSIGGDGTFLRAAKLSLLCNSALVFPYPCGRRNAFYELITTPPSDLVDKLLEGDYFIDLYPSLTVCTSNKCELFLNEVAIVNSNLGKAAKYRVQIKSPLINSAFTIEGDGLLISTSPGSSGYNLSARGPLTSPLLDSIIITPLNPLQVGLPPIVLPHVSVIEVAIANSSTIYIDGNFLGVFEKDSVIQVTYSSRYVKVIRFSPSRDLVRAVLASRAFT